MNSGKFLAFVLTVMMAFAGTSAFASGDGDAKKGKKVYKKCKACHAIVPGKNKLGPTLAGIMGKKAGTVEGFTKYKALKEADFIWDEDNMEDWVKDQKKFLKKKGLPTKTSMKVKIKKEKDQRNLIAYLKTL